MKLTCDDKPCEYWAIFDVGNLVKNPASTGKPELIKTEENGKEIPVSEQLAGDENAYQQPSTSCNSENGAEVFGGSDQPAGLLTTSGVFPTRDAAVGFLVNLRGQMGGEEEQNLNLDSDVQRFENLIVKCVREADALRIARGLLNPEGGVFYAVYVPPPLPASESDPAAPHAISGVDGLESTTKAEVGGNSDAKKQEVVDPSGVFGLKSEADAILKAEKARGPRFQKCRDFASAERFSLTGRAAGVKRRGGRRNSYGLNDGDEDAGKEVGGIIGAEDVPAGRSGIGPKSGGNSEGPGKGAAEMDNTTSGSKTGDDSNRVGGSKSEAAKSGGEEGQELPFKQPPRADLLKLRQAVEKNRPDDVRRIVWSNPRYLINACGDTATLLHEGPRYNALHIAARSQTPECASVVLDAISDTNYISLLYPADLDGQLAERRRVLRESYLNTPDKSMFRTPLHWAVKNGGSPELISLLLDQPETHLTPTDKYGQSPLHLAITEKRVDTFSTLVSDARFCPAQVDRAGLEGYITENVSSSADGKRLKSVLANPGQREEFYVALYRDYDFARNPVVRVVKSDLPVQICDDEQNTGVESSRQGSTSATAIWGQNMNEPSPNNPDNVDSIRSRRDLRSSPNLDLDGFLKAGGRVSPPDLSPLRPQIRPSAPEASSSVRFLAAAIGPCALPLAEQLCRDWDRAGSGKAARGEWRDLKRSDLHKGMERIGRQLAAAHEGLGWAEHWPLERLLSSPSASSSSLGVPGGAGFVIGESKAVEGAGERPPTTGVSSLENVSQNYLNLSTPEGLASLNEYLGSKRKAKSTLGGRGPHGRMSSRGVSKMGSGGSPYAPALSSRLFSSGRSTSVTYSPGKYRRQAALNRARKICRADTIELDQDQTVQDSMSAAGRPGVVDGEEPARKLLDFGREGSEINEQDKNGVTQENKDGMEQETGGEQVSDQVSRASIMSPHEIMSIDEGEDEEIFHDSQSDFDDYLVAGAAASGSNSNAFVSVNAFVTRVLPDVPADADVSFAESDASETADIRRKLTEQDLDLGMEDEDDGMDENGVADTKTTSFTTEDARKIVPTVPPETRNVVGPSDNDQLCHKSPTPSSSTTSNSDLEFEMPPDKPLVPLDFMAGSRPSKLDEDILKALEDGRLIVTAGDRIISRHNMRDRLKSEREGERELNSNQQTDAQASSSGEASGGENDNGLETGEGREKDLEKKGGENVNSAGFNVDINDYPNVRRWLNSVKFYSDRERHDWPSVDSYRFRHGSTEDG